MVLSTTASTTRASVPFLSLECSSLLFASPQAEIPRLTLTFVSSFPPSQTPRALSALAFERAIFSPFASSSLQTVSLLSCGVFGRVDVYLCSQNRCVLCEQHVFELASFFFWSRSFIGSVFPGMKGIVVPSSLLSRPLSLPFGGKY